MSTTTVDVHVKLFNAVSEHDRKESRKAGYNRFALGHYASGLQNIRRHVAAGHGLRDAIMTEFCGRLCDRMLKAADLPLMTKEETKGWFRKLPELDDDE